MKVYPKHLTPDSTELYTLEGISYVIPVVNTSLNKYQGKEVINTFGGKPVLEFNNDPVFAELAIQRIASQDKWDSRWVETYAQSKKLPYFFTGWTNLPLKEQVVSPIKDNYVMDVLSDISKGNGDSYSGCWDVVAWKDDNIVFFESKHYKKDFIRTTQLNWMKAALKQGLCIDQFVIVQWKYL